LLDWLSLFHNWNFNFLCFWLLRFSRLIVWVLSWSAPFEVEKLREVGAFLIAARPSFISIVKNWISRMKNATS
jgi:hypothetical protein